MLGDVRTGGGGSGESLGDDSGVWFLSGSSNWPEVLTLESFDYSLTFVTSYVSVLRDALILVLVSCCSVPGC